MKRTIKAEVRVVVYFERLPHITMNVSVAPLECLKRLEEIAIANGKREVRSNYEGDGDLHCNVVSLADKNEKEHEGLFGMFVHWKRDGQQLRLQLAASRWNPDPPTYNSYVAAAHRLLQPVISAYNKKFRVRHRMRIQTREETQPRMTPKAKEAFDHFAFHANKSALHPLDYDAFYRFVYVCHRTKLYLYEDEIRWFCRRAGFSVEQSNYLSSVFLHCYHFYEWFRRGRR